MTETTKSKTERTNGHSDTVPALTDQMVMSTAGVASQGLSTLRHLADATLGTTDRTVLGLFDIADQVVRSNMFADIANKTVALARDSWSAGVNATRELLVDM